VLAGVLAILIGAAADAWWIARRALPQLDGTATVPGLASQVRVDRDAWGVPYITAGSVEDMAMAQGYVTAQDRLWQMDVLRRVGEGEISEVVGAGPGGVALSSDRLFRTYGIKQAAERDAAAALDPDSRLMFEAYARGVNAFIASHQNRLPWEFVALGYKPRPWTPADSLAIVGYMCRTLSNTWPQEIDRAWVTQKAGPDRAAQLFSQDSPDDRVIVGATIAGPIPSSTIARSEEVNVAPGFSPPLPSPHANSQAASAEAEAFSLVAGSDENNEDVRAGTGSNNWVVSGAHTVSGKPLLANDPHLELSMPDIWYAVHLTAPGWNLAGVALPGEPLVIIGHNDRIAWGFTNDGADVQDLYIETFDSANSANYRANGQWLKADVRTEQIKIRGEATQQLDVYTTRHGPIVQRDGNTGYALQWTALQPGGLSHSYLLMGRAQNWQEFKDALRDVVGPAQNAVYADVDGNIGFIVAAKIPIRKKGDGSVPVPGDTDDYGWTGYIPFGELPQVLNPPGGIIATANARVVGPNYPHYITDRWAAPWRAERIYDLLAAKNNLSPADMNAFQNDVLSIPDQRLAAALVQASRAALPQDTRTRDLLARLTNWDGRADATSVEDPFVLAAREAFLNNILSPYLGDDTDRYTWRSAVFVDWLLRERPANWLPQGYRNYDELLIHSADDAVAHLTAATHNSDSSAWTLGALNALTIYHPLGRISILRDLFSIGPLPQSGDVFTVKAMTRTHGPSMRFVADLSNWDNSLLEITTGESGQFLSSHNKDQFSEWYAGRPIVSHFSDAAEQSARVHTLLLTPSP
jgi:penicillin G amidase